MTLFALFSVTTTFPYVNLGVTPGVDTQFVGSLGYSSEIPVAFPFIFFIQTTLHVRRSHYDTHIYFL